ncbi:hypothetical protein FUSNEC_GEN_298_06865 [Fusobacterium necrophorum subsp. funduliforme]
MEDKQKGFLGKVAAISKHLDLPIGFGTVNFL